MRKEELSKIQSKFNEYIKSDYEKERAEKYAKERADFVEKYGIDKLKKLTLKEYFDLAPNNKETLWYQIEYGRYAPDAKSKQNKDKDFYMSNGEYVNIGNPKVGFTLEGVEKSIIYKKHGDKNYRINKKEIKNNDEAEELWKKLRNHITSFISKIGKANNVSEIKYNEYFNKDELNKVLGKKVYKNNSEFKGYLFLMYLATQHYPDKFLGIGRINQIDKVINALELNIESDNILEKSFELNKFLRENIKGVEKQDPIVLFDVVRDVYNLFTKDGDGGNDGGSGHEGHEGPEGGSNVELENGKNIIIYGVPGSGKSYYIKEKLKKKDSYYIERVTFYPEYTYYDFVGQMVPKKDGNGLEFKEGNLTRILRKALIDQDNNYYLIIEELNRGNAEAIFGDIFQLLDREAGKSEYQISNIDMINHINSYLEEKIDKIILPKNLIIYATINNADQNVFNFDTAFGRRWEYELMPCDGNGKITKENKIFYKGYIKGTKCKWNDVRIQINKKILEYKDEIYNAEDKRLGLYYINKEWLSDSAENMEESCCEEFGNKIFRYLYLSVFRNDSKNKIFKNEEKILEDYILDFKNNKKITDILDIDIKEDNNE